MLKRHTDRKVCMTMTFWIQLILEQSILTVCYHVVIKLSEIHWSIITIWTWVCVRACVRKNVWLYLCITDDENKQASPCFSPIIPPPFFFLLTSLPLSPPVLSSQTAVLTCVTGTASAPWGSRVGIVNARQAGGDLAAVLQWRPLALTTRTTKEVNWGKWEKMFGRNLVSAAPLKIPNACERNKG